MNYFHKSIVTRLVIAALALTVFAGALPAQQDQLSKKESLYYSLTDIHIPDSIVLEVGGLAFNDKGQLAVATRQGEIWIIDDPYTSKRPRYTRFARGLHEALGLAFHEGSYYTAQRGELTKITDTDGDGRADLFNTVSAWPLTGNYHEYSYGPLLLPNGQMVVTLNLAWIGGGMRSVAKWRGWTLKIDPDGRIHPYATGMRSPAGFGLNAEGDLFYGENQGGWIGSGWITHIEQGDFTGNPAGLAWASEPESPVKRLPDELFPDSVGTMYEFAKKHPEMKPPTVWFPQGIMGISTSGILNIDPAGFGPYKDQLLVGDQGQSKVMRVFLEKVAGEYQGACFPLREGFSSGPLRMVWGKDATLFVGMTSRGWSSTGKSPYGLQKLTWTGKTPFEMKAIRAMPDGFEIEFTMPVNRSMASRTSAYKITGFTYIYHKQYGSPVINRQDCPIGKVELSEDGKKARVYTSGLREGYIHEVRIQDLLSASGLRPLHDFAYYTLNHIPGGAPGAGHAHGEADKSATAAACGSDATKNITAQPTAWTNGPDITINISTQPNLQYDKKEFTVKAGSRVKLTFTNTDDMLHNLLVTRPGQLKTVGLAAAQLALDGSALGYIPPSPDVLFHTCLLQPGEAQTIYFTAPAQPGDYPYVCTYPGHYLTMNGTMKVE